MRGREEEPNGANVPLDFRSEAFLASGHEHTAALAPDDVRALLRPRLHARGPHRDPRDQCCPTAPRRHRPGREPAPGLVQARRRAQVRLVRLGPATHARRRLDRPAAACASRPSTAQGTGLHGRIRSPAADRGCARRSRTSRTPSGPATGSVAPVERTHDDVAATATFLRCVIVKDLRSEPKTLRVVAPQRSQHPEQSEQSVNGIPSNSGGGVNRSVSRETPVSGPASGRPRPDRSKGVPHEA